MSTTVCEPNKHEYVAQYTNCSNCNKGYVICSNCDGDGTCLNVCDKGLVHCPEERCQYGQKYQFHYCIKCSKTIYVK